jgi:hypothetical protein
MATTTEDERKLHAVDDKEAFAREADAAGLTIEELTAKRREEGLLDEEPEEDRPVPPTQQPLPGTFETISSSAGGTKPTSSELRIMGARRPIDGQFAKGDIVMVEAEIKIGEVDFIDTSDDWGNISKTVRAHKGRLLSVRIASK